MSEIKNHLPAAVSRDVAGKGVGECPVTALQPVSLPHRKDRSCQGQKYSRWKLITSAKEDLKKIMTVGVLLDGLITGLAVAPKSLLKLSELLRK